MKIIIMRFCENWMPFEMNQLLIGRDVLLLHESSSAPLNTRVLDCYIQEYLV